MYSGNREKVENKMFNMNNELSSEPRLPLRVPVVYTTRFYRSKYSSAVHVCVRIYLQFNAIAKIFILRVETKQHTRSTPKSTPSIYILGVLLFNNPYAKQTSRAHVGNPESIHTLINYSSLQNPKRGLLGE
jgi:hypothetical protein